MFWLGVGFLIEEVVLTSDQLRKPYNYCHLFWVQQLSQAEWTGGETKNSVPPFTEKGVVGRWVDQIDACHDLPGLFNCMPYCYRCMGYAYMRPPRSGQQNQYCQCFRGG